MDAADLWGLPAAQAEQRLRERLGRALAGRRDRARPGSGCVRYATISHDGRHAGRGGLGAVLGAKNAQGGRGARRAPRSRRPTRPACSPPPGPAGPLVRPGHREVPRARHAGQPARVQRDHALPTRNFQAATFDGAPRLAAEELARAARRRAQQLRLLHDRLRAHLPSGGGRHDAGGIRERLRARPDVRGVRSRRRARRQRPVRRAGPRHHLRRRHDRLGDGVRRARPDRRAVAALRRRGRAAAGPRRDRCQRRAR